jgi:hypothetical protein
MWPWILGGATLGGLQAYGQSGGDIGKTLIGAGIGGGLGKFAPAGIRMAGAFAGGPATAAIAPGLYRAAQRLNNPLATAGTLLSGQKLAPITTPLIAQQLGGQALLSKAGAGLAGLGLTAAIPAVASGIASATPQIFGGGSRKASDALQGSMQLLGAGRQLTSPEITGDWNPQDVRSVSGYGPDGYLRVADPLGPVAGQVLAGKLNALGQLEQQKILAPYALGMMDKVTDKEMLRQAAMAQLKTQLAQGAQAMSQAQLGAQSLAQQGMGGMIAAAAQRGGYV